MSPQPRKPKAPHKPKAPVKHAAASTRSAKPKQPHFVAFEAGLVDYTTWVKMFAGADIPPLPEGERRGRVWA